MILHDLVDYYERKSRDPESDLAPPGFELKEIPFLIVIDAQGQLVQIEDTRRLEGKKMRARSFLVPQGVKRANNICANLLWDNLEYVLGIDTRGKPERVAEQHAAYTARLADLPATDAGLKAVLSFLEHIPYEQLAESPLWEEIRTSNPVLTFKLIGDTELVCQRPAIINALQQAPTAEKESLGYCLVTGEHGPIERLHPSIKGVWGAQTAGANIVSFNQRSFESYGKEQRQGENAPISKRAVFAYSTALNHLLGKDSRKRMQVGDASAVFWADKKDCALERDFPSFWSDSKDDPDRLSSAVKALYQSVSHGSLAADSETTRFFVLGLAPVEAD